jgi:hypothetical protein
MERPSDAEILAFEKSIKQEYMCSDLIGAKISTRELFKEFDQGDPVYQSKLNSLAEAFSSIRKVRKDGNCFYRALAFSFAEIAIQSPKALETLQAASVLMTECGYDMELLQDFYQVFLDACSLKSVQELVEFFNVEYQSDTIVCFLRLLTAAVLKKDAILYEAFIMDDYPDLQAFISNQVEPMNVEADQIQIVAMANALNCCIKIANLDHSAVGEAGINYHEIMPREETEWYKIYLLFKPGHYDVIYE